MCVGGGHIGERWARWVSLHSSSGSRRSLPWAQTAEGKTWLIGSVRVSPTCRIDKFIINIFVYTKCCFGVMLSKECIFFDKFIVCRLRDKKRIQRRGLIVTDDKLPSQPPASYSISNTRQLTRVSTTATNCRCPCYTPRFKQLLVFADIMKVAFETLSFSLRSKNQLVFSSNFWIILAVQTSLHHICVVWVSIRNKHHGWQVLTPVGFPLAHLMKCFAQNLCIPKIGPIFLLQTPQVDCCVFGYILKPYLICVTSVIFEMSTWAPYILRVCIAYFA